VSELEDELEKSPFDVDLFRVYGDRLLAEGDPQGKLIQLQASGAGGPFSEDHHRLYCEEILPSSVMRSHRIQWHLGFPRLLHIDCGDSIAPLSAALTPRLRRLLSHVVMGITDRDTDWSEITDLLVGLPVKRLTYFYPPMPGSRWLRQAPIRSVLAFVAALPALPRLDELAVMCTDLDAQEVSALIGARPRLPANCRLAVRAGISSEELARLRGSWLMAE
jgi:hypothetical protein